MDRIKKNQSHCAQQVSSTKLFLPGCARMKAHGPPGCARMKGHGPPGCARRKACGLPRCARRKAYGPPGCARMRQNFCPDANVRYGLKLYMLLKVNTSACHIYNAYFGIANPIGNPAGMPQAPPMEAPS